MQHEKYWSNKNNSGHRTIDSDYYKRKAKEHVFYLDGIKGRKCLDIGCGAGELLEFLIDDVNVTEAIDFSTSMLAEAKNRLKTSNIVFSSPDTLSYLKSCSCEAWITCQAINQYLTKKQLCNVLDAFLKNKNVMSFSMFDTICPSRYLLVHRSRVLDYTGAKIRHSYYKKIYGFLSGLLLSVFSPKTLDYMSLAETGYAFSPKFLIKEASNRGLSIEIVSSSYYEYRYHVFIRK